MDAVAPPAAGRTRPTAHDAASLHFDDGTVIIPADHFLAHGLLPTVARVLAIPSTTQIILPPRKYPG